MSDADRVNLAYSQEATFGSDVGLGTKTPVRFTGESLKQTTASANSAEIRPDRQISDVVRTSIQADGDINFEFSAETFDDLLEAGIQSADWSANTDVTDTTYAAVAAGAQFTDSSNGFITDGFAVNQIIRISGFANEENNGFALITSITAGTIDVSWLTPVDEAAGPSVTISQLSYIENGTTQRSFGIEKHFTDLTDNYAYYNGMTVNTMALALSADAIITGTVGFLGIKAESRNAPTNGVAPEKNENEVMSSVDGIDGIFEDNIDECTQTFTIDVANNLRNRKCIGKQETDSIGAGIFTVSGTFQKFYESFATIDKYLNFDNASLAVIAEDGEGNGYVFWMPRVKYSNGQRVAGGQNSDVLADMAYSAFRDPTTGITMRVARFTAP